MTTRAVFVSDIHISSADDPKALLFAELLQKCLVLRVDHLFLVGDIFDFWIADRKYLRHDYQSILSLIQKLIDRGTRVHYFEGNHDLDLQRLWQQQMGAVVHTQAAYFHIGPVTVRVEHGDQMDPSDRGYLFLRWFLRTRVMIWLGRWLPEKTVQSIGARASAKSRNYTSQVKIETETRARDKVRLHARNVYRQKPFQVFVSGHVHVSEDSLQVVDGGSFRCFNLGTWLKEPLLLEIQDSTSNLKSVAEFLKEPAT